MVAGKQLPDCNNAVERAHQAPHYITHQQISAAEKVKLYGIACMQV